MSNPIEIDLSEQGHLVEPPIVDFLAYDPDLQALVAEFVPDPALSNQRKESIYLRDGSDSARRVRELLIVLAEVCELTTPVTRLAHAGAGNFSIYTLDGKLFELHETQSPAQTMDAYIILQTLSQEIEFEFVRQRRLRRRQAS